MFQTNNKLEDIKTICDIRTVFKSRCFLCGCKGKRVYQHLRDFIFNVPGEWNFKKCSNPECGLLWLDPMPITEDIPKLYNQYYTHTVDGQLPNFIGSVYERIREGILAVSFGYEEAVKSRTWLALGKLLSGIPLACERIGGTIMWLKASQKGRLLDIGCGNGKLLNRMRKLGWDVTGIETDHEAVRLIRSKLQINVYKGNLEQAQFPGDTFDAITMHHVIEHLPDPLETLTECRRVLREDGILVLTTPNAESLGSIRYGMDWRGLEPPRHIYMFTIKSIQRAIKDAGFIIETVGTLAKLAPQIWATSDSIRIKRLRQKDRDNSDGSFRRKIRAASLGFKYVVYQLWESVCLYSNPLIGEEILVIARKPRG